MIAIFDNVISESQVQYCLDKFNMNLPIREYFGKYLIDNDEHFKEDAVFNEILSIVHHKALMLNPNVSVDWSHLNFWPTHSLQNLHHDTKSDETVLTSITYLNSSYRGGETFFEDGTSVSPVIGRTVCFNGIKYLHGVRPISQGTRFTLSVWYKIKG